MFICSQKLNCREKSTKLKNDGEAILKFLWASVQSSTASFLLDTEQQRLGRQPSLESLRGRSSQEISSALGGMLAAVRVTSTPADPGLAHSHGGEAPGGVKVDVCGVAE